MRSFHKKGIGEVIGGAGVEGARVEGDVVDGSGVIEGSGARYSNTLSQGQAARDSGATGRVRHPSFPSAPIQKPLKGGSFRPGMGWG